MKIEIRNGNLSLVKSDTILVCEDQDVTLTFDEQFLLVIHFVEDSKIKENKMEIENVEKGITIKLINFNNPIGVATKTPIPFAFANEKPVYISFAVYSINKSKVLHYNVYTEQ